MNTRPKATRLLELCKEGILDPNAVLANVLVNYMSSHDAEGFAESEYSICDCDCDCEDSNC